MRKEHDSSKLKCRKSLCSAETEAVKAGGDGDGDGAPYVSSSPPLSTATQLATPMQANNFWNSVHSRAKTPLLLSMQAGRQNSGSTRSRRPG